MTRATIAGLLPLLFVAGCVSTSENPMSKDTSPDHDTQDVLSADRPLAKSRCNGDRREKEVIPGYTRDRLSKVRFKDFQTSPAVFHDLYTLYSTQIVTVGDAGILIELHSKRYPVLVYYDQVPSSIVVVKSGDRQIMLKIDQYRPLEEIRHRVPKTTPPVLCIFNANGGNCWNCRPWYVLSLEERSFLENLGEVSVVRDYNKDGIDDMVWFEDIWENGLGWFCHADAPGAIIYYHIEKSKLVPDAARNAQHWKNEIRQFNAQINALSRKTSKYSDAEIVELRHHRFFWPHLQVILMKFLRYRLLGESEKGWEELRKDLRHHDDQYFFFTFSGAGSGNGKVKTGKFPIQNIENTVRESLEHFRRLKEAP